MISHEYTEHKSNLNASFDLLIYELDVDIIAMHVHSSVKDHLIHVLGRSVKISPKCHLRHSYTYSRSSQCGYCARRPTN